MKKALLVIGEPISNLSMLTASVTSSVTNTNGNLDRKNKQLNEDDLKKINELMIEKNASLFEKIQSDILNDKVSSTKLANNISNNDISEMVFNFGNILYSMNKISSQDFEKIKSSLDDENFSKIRKEIKKFYLKQKKEFKKSAELTKKFKEQHKIVFTDKLKNYKVNIISDEENSKKIGLEFSELCDLLKQGNTIKDDIISQIKRLNNILRNLTIATISISVISGLSTILGFLCPVFGFLVIPVGVTSIGLLIATDIIKNELDSYNQRLRIYNKFFNKLNILSNDNKPWLDAVNHLWTILFGVSIQPRFHLYSELVKNSKGVQFASELKMIKRVSVGLSLVSVIGDVANSIISSLDLRQIDKKASIIQDFEDKLSEIIISITKRFELLREYRWVVIDESEQTDYYYNGGKGGKNLVFKNLQTNEEKTIKEMLEYDNWYLNRWNLIKVYNPALQEWYIRKLPNKIKEDNLG